MFAAFHDDAQDAIREGNMLAAQTGIPHVVGYAKGMGWTCYDPRNGAAPSVEPELLCFALGKVSLPLSDAGFDVLFSALAAIWPPDTVARFPGNKCEPSARL
jgi:hypothetical protein